MPDASGSVTPDEAVSVPGAGTPRIIGQAQPTALRRERPSRPRTPAGVPPPIDRQALYELVWSVPRIHLRARFGLTDNAFRRWCRALRVPLPRAGHWSRIAAGHVIVPAPLPPWTPPAD